MSFDLVSYTMGMANGSGGGGGGGGILPSGFTQLQYIQSTGVEYIDTGVKDSAGMLCIARACYVSARGEWDTICGAQDAASTVNADGLIMAYYNSGNYASYIVNNTVDTNIPIVMGVMVDIISDTRAVAHYFNVAGKRYFRTLAGSRGNYNLFLFGLNSAGNNSYQSIARIEHLALFDSSGTLIRDFYAAKRNSDNVLGMYDLVSQTLFTNQGTGAFIAGPEV